MNFKAVLAMPKTARSAQTHKSISFIWIVWSTLYVYLCMNFQSLAILGTHCLYLVLNSQETSHLYGQSWFQISKNNQNYNISLWYLLCGSYIIILIVFSFFASALWRKHVRWGYLRTILCWRLEIKVQIIWHWRLNGFFFLSRSQK